MNAKPPARLLIVDDEAALTQALASSLALEGYETEAFTSPAGALAALRERRFELLLTDLEMPGLDGIALIEAAREIDPRLAGIVMTGHGAIESAVRAMKSGALDYIVKPFRLDRIRPVLERALEIRRLLAENLELKEAVAIFERANGELENRVRERTRELELANEDLEAFSFSVSHDLQAPLRVAHGFCQMFLADHGAAVPAEGRRQLEHVSDATRRMARMIEGLLAFSRLGRQPLTMRPVPLAEIVARTVSDLERSAGGRRIEVIVGELPPCRGDPALLEHVLMNLLSNAFKFTRGRDPARIEVGHIEEPEAHLYFVRDNGAGFDMRYADRLFGVFQRLHRESDFEGTGVGLSIAHRIIRRHGGSLTAESRPGEGATFRFRLPK
jgi:two-component system, sensor histidine kinase and response regulator